MSLYYKVVSTYKPGSGKEGEKIYFPKLTGSSQVTLKDICCIIQQRTSCHGADTVGVLYAFQKLLPELLCEGKTVYIEGFGTFRLHAKVKTRSSDEDVTSRDIKEFRISFRPDNEMKKLLKGTKAEKKG